MTYVSSLLHRGVFRPAPVVVIDWTRAGAGTEVTQFDTSDEIEAKRTINLLRTIDSVIDDKNVSTVVFRIDSIPRGRANEVYASIIRLRESGKCVIVHAKDISQAVTLAAIAPADNIYLENDQSVFAVMPLIGAAVTKRRYLEKFYLKVKGYRSKHTNLKSAWEVHALDEPSDEDIKARAVMLDATNNLLYKMITIWLPLTRIDLERLQYNVYHGVCSGAGLTEAIGKSVVELESWDSLKARLRSRYNVEPVEHLDYLQRLPNSNRAPEVALLSIRGMVVDKTGAWSGGINIAWIDKACKAIAQNPHIKIVVVDLDGPGGNIDVSDKVVASLGKLKTAGKRVIVSANASMIASADYQIAVNADEIVASPLCEVGSIGVIVSYLDGDTTFEKAGFSLRHISRAEPKPSDRLMDEMVEISYMKFVNGVARGRGLKVGDVIKLATGGMYNAHDALRYGLVDQIGSLYYSLLIARRAVGNPDAVIAWYCPGPNLLQKLTSMMIAQPHNLTANGTV